MPKENKLNNKKVKKKTNIKKNIIINKITKN